MKEFCPILVIGFAAPKNGERDMRTCKTDCAWYDRDCEACKITIIADYAAEVMRNTADTVDILADEPIYDKEF